MDNFQVSSNETCQFCERDEASLFCKCTGTAALFCMKCSMLHHSKYPRAIHQVMPIAALNRNIEEYKQKAEALSLAAAELRRNLDLMEQYSIDFADLMQRSINFLIEYRNRGLQKLQTEKEELRNMLESAIQETNLCLDQGIAPVNPLAQAMWQLPPEELQVFMPTVDAPDLQTLCQSWTHYQNSLSSLCERFAERHIDANREESGFFAAIYENSVELYDLATQQSSQHTIDVDFGMGGSFIALDMHTLMCLGAFPIASAVYALDLPSLRLTTLPALGTARTFAGVAKSPRFIYVFGGNVPDHNTCEKYSLEEPQWLPLSPMKYSRWGFTPCSFHDLIYLLSPRTTPAIESFNPDTETFTELPVTLPRVMKLSTSSVAFVIDEELCILTPKNQMGRWKIDSEREFRVSVIDRLCWSTQPPLRVGNLVLIANNGKVEKFSLESYSFI